MIESKTHTYRPNIEINKKRRGRRGKSVPYTIVEHSIIGFITHSHSDFSQDDWNRNCRHRSKRDNKYNPKISDLVWKIWTKSRKKALPSNKSAHADMLYSSNTIVAGVLLLMSVYPYVCIYVGGWRRNRMSILSKCLISIMLRARFSLIENNTLLLIYLKFSEMCDVRNPLVPLMSLAYSNLIFIRFFFHYTFLFILFVFDFNAQQSRIHHYFFFTFPRANSIFFPSSIYPHVFLIIFTVCSLTNAWLLWMSLEFAYIL